MRVKGPRISEKGYLEQGMIVTQLGQETDLKLEGLADILAGSVGSKNAHATQRECLGKFPHLISQFIQIVANPKPKLLQAL
jgi:hypothetical protein